MFRIGAAYKLKIYEDDKIRSYQNMRAIEQAGSIVRFDRSGFQMVVNTVSPCFVSAEIELLHSRPYPEAERRRIPAPPFI